MPRNHSDGRYINKPDMVAFNFCIPRNLHDAIKGVNDRISFTITAFIRLAVYEYAIAIPRPEITKEELELMNINKSSNMNISINIPKPLLTYLDELSIFLNIDRTLLLRVIVRKYIKRFIPSSIQREWRNSKEAKKSIKRKKFVDECFTKTLRLSIFGTRTSYFSLGLLDEYYCIDIYFGKTKYRRIRMMISFDEGIVKCLVFAKNGKSVLTETKNKIRGKDEDSIIDAMYDTIKEAKFLSRYINLEKEPIMIINNGYALWSEIVNEDNYI